MRADEWREDGGFHQHSTPSRYVTDRRLPLRPFDIVVVSPFSPKNGLVRKLESPFVGILVYPSSGLKKTRRTRQ